MRFPILPALKRHSSKYEMSKQPVAVFHFLGGGRVDLLKTFGKLSYQPSTSSTKISVSLPRDHNSWQPRPGYSHHPLPLAGAQPGSYRPEPISGSEEALIICLAHELPSQYPWPLFISSLMLIPYMRRVQLHSLFSSVWVFARQGPSRVPCTSRNWPWSSN